MLICRLSIVNERKYHFILLFASTNCFILPGILKFHPNYEKYLFTIIMVKVPWNTFHFRPKCAYIFKCRWSFNFHYDVPTCQKATNTTTITTKSICLHYRSQGSHGKNIPSAIDYYDMKPRVLFHLMIYVCCN